MGPHLVLAAATLLAFFLAFNQINQRSFWLDEATTYFVSGVSWARLAEILSGDAHGWHPPTYFVLLKAWRSVVGDGQADLRGFSMLFAVASVPTTYFLVRHIASAWPAALAALLIACNGFVIRYAQEARTYTLTMFLAILATWVLVRAVDGRGRWHWAAYVVVAVLGVYSQLFFGLVVGAHLLAVLAQRPPARDLLGPALAFGATALLTSPLLIASLMGSGEILNWVRPIEWDSFRRLAESVSGGTTAAMVAYGAGVLLALAWMAGPGRGWQWTPLLLLWLALPAVVLAGASLIKPIFVLRYLIVSVPALVIVVAVGAASLPRWATLALAPLLVLTSIFGVTDWYASEYRAYRQIAVAISRDATEHDGIMLWRSQFRKPLAYQMVRLPPAHTPPHLLTPPRPWDWNSYESGVPPATDARERLVTCSLEQLWLVGGPKALERWNSHTTLDVPASAYTYADSRRISDVSVHRHVRNDQPCPP
jgi:mannosyltransferase